MGFLPDALDVAGSREVVENNSDHCLLGDVIAQHSPSVLIFAPVSFVAHRHFSIDFEQGKACNSQCRPETIG
jgi:hypothetical protein